MNPGNGVNERMKLESQVTFLRRVIFGGVGVTAVLAVGLVWTVFNSTVLVMPPEVKRPYELGANYANKEYLADMAGYVLDMVGTVAPDRVDYNNKIILKMTDPDGYGPLKSTLDAAAIRVKRERVTTVWVARKEEVSERELKVRASGRLKTYIADQLTSERDKEYLVEFTITSSGRLYVVKIEEVLKPEPKPSAAVAQQSS
jgi:conjugal transfer pilus assembly protein TraE